MSERLLGGNTRYFVEPRMLLSLLERGEHRTRFGVTDSNTIVLVRIGSHPKAPIVDVSARPKNPGKLLLLFVGGVESELTPKLHSQIVMEINFYFNRRGAIPLSLLGDRGIAVTLYEKSYSSRQFRRALLGEIPTRELRTTSCDNLR